MEQLIWAIILIIFTIFIALKNRARNRPDTNIDRTTDKEHKTEDERDKLARYMEEILGIEVPSTKQRIRVEEEKPKPLVKRVRPKPEPEIKKKVSQFESPLSKKYEKKWETPVPEERKISHAKFPWGTLSKKDLPNAIILSEIIGPPISKRKSHRLF
jgi:hypothetical protein